MTSKFVLKTAKNTKHIPYHAISMELLNAAGGTYTSVTVKKGYKNKIREGCHETAAI
jgi:hypothetical protein